MSLAPLAGGEGEAGGLTSHPRSPGEVSIFSAHAQVRLTPPI